MNAGSLEPAPDELCDAFFDAAERLSNADEGELWVDTRHVRWTVSAAAAPLVLGITVDLVRKNRVELPPSTFTSLRAR